jgi:hypothetical protein
VISYWERKRQAEEKKPRFAITYEVGILTLITFVLSVISLGWQILNYLQGAKIKLIPPDQILIGSSERVDFPSRDGGSYVHFIIRMSYVNEGATGYNATTRRERIKIRLDGHPEIEQRWYRFVTFDASGPSGAGLKVEKSSDARPLPIMAGNSESHATLFQPWPKQCPLSSGKCDSRDSYLGWDAFLELFRHKRVLEVEIMAEAYGQMESVSAKCRIEMPEQSFLAMKERGWGSPVCQ